jgi:hypothetical protein
MKILGINPWIYDFAAFDFWLKPYGFLGLLSYIQNQGPEITYIDCLEKTIKKDKFGRREFYSQAIEKPPIFSQLKRIYKRYGKTPEEFEQDLPDKTFDYILVTSSMTYWYPAIFETLRIIRKKYPLTPLILGGTYVNLCYKHAKFNLDTKTFLCRNQDLKYLFNKLNLKYSQNHMLNTLVKYQCFYPDLPYLVFRTSWGCPFNCSYCAIKKLSSGFRNIPLKKLINYILDYSKKGIKDFVLYDDAFLYNTAYVKDFLSEIKKTAGNSIRFHTPNALHMRYLNKQVCRLMKETGFVNPHFGIETLEPRIQKDFKNKVNTSQILKGIDILKESGFTPGNFSFYLLLGYPGQDLSQLKKEINFLHKKGARVSLSEFSLIPGSEIFQRYRQRFSEPLLHNNSVFSLIEPSNLETVNKIKNYTRKLNREFD